MSNESKETVTLKNDISQCVDPNIFYSIGIVQFFLRKPFNFYKATVSALNYGLGWNY